MQMLGSHSINFVVNQMQILWFLGKTFIHWQLQFVWLFFMLPRRCCGSLELLSYSINMHLLLIEFS